MNLRPVISIPLPWLTAVMGFVFGRSRLRAVPSLRLPRSLSVTSEGKWYIGILLFIGVAAINTGNNLLYLIVATLLSLIIVSGLISESTLRGLRVRRRLPPRVFKGAPVLARYEITNTKGHIPSYSFYATESRTDGLVAGSSYTLKLDPGAAAHGTAEYAFQRRGRHFLVGLDVTTRFPFGLFVKGKHEPCAAEVIVFPSIKASTGGALERGQPLSGSHAAMRKGEGSQLYGLRYYTALDDSRFIHWRSAARTQKLFVKEFESEREKRVMVVFENRQTDDEKEFEDAVDECASVVNFHIERGCSVGLRTLADETAPRPGAAQLTRILGVLALIEPAGPRGRPAVRALYL